MRLKKLLISLLESFLTGNPWFIFIFLDNPIGKNIFLSKYFENRPEEFLRYYKWKPVLGNPQKILILKTDAIGDYLLFRNYLEAIANHFRPKGYRIYLAGNQAWRELALFLDKEFADEFFWLNRGGMNQKPKQESRIDFLSEINKNSYQSVLYPNYSREWEAGDWLIQHIPAKQKFGFRGNTVNETPFQQQEGNHFYSNLLEPEQGVKFDFLRNGEIVSAFLGKPGSVRSPFIRVRQIVTERPPYAILFPGASLEDRRWPRENFITLANKISKEIKLQIIVAGGHSEKELCEQIQNAHPDLIQSLAGKTSLPELVELISGAKLLVSNDTSAIHIGAQSGIPSICIYKGNNYGRCMPYPDGLIPNLGISMPPDLEKLPEDERKIQFSETDGIEIHDISVEHVWALILKVINSHTLF